MFRASAKSKAEHSARVGRRGGTRVDSESKIVRAATGLEATSTIQWRSVSQWVSTCETEIARKSKKLYRRVNNIEFSTVTFLRENANSMEVSRSCRRETLLHDLLARFWGSVLMFRWLQGEGSKLQTVQGNIISGDRIPRREVYSGNIGFQHVDK